MGTDRKPGKIIRIVTAVLIVWGSPWGTLQAADDYLSILEAEAGDVGNNSGMSATPVSSKQPSVPTRFKNSDSMSPGLDFGSFEAELDNHYSGSHFLYVKLSKSDRKRVYNLYREDGRISAIREKIVSLLSSG